MVVAVGKLEQGGMQANLLGNGCRLFGNDIIGVLESLEGEVGLSVQVRGEHAGLAG